MNSPVAFISLWNPSENSVNIFLTKDARNEVRKEKPFRGISSTPVTIFLIVELEIK